MLRCLPLLIVCLAVSCGSEPPPPTTPAKPTVGSTIGPEGTPKQVGPLVMQPGVLDFGTIGPKSAHRGVVQLINAGKEPVRIIRGVSTCLCTTPENIDGATIAPGAYLEFSTTFKAPSESGEKTAQLNIFFATGAEQQRGTISLRGLIERSIRSQPPFVDALKGVTSGTVVVESKDGKPFRILSADLSAPRFEDGYDHGRDPPRSRYTLAWSYQTRSLDECEGAPLWWVLETDRADCPILPLRIRHECTGGQSDMNRFARGWSFKGVIADIGGIRPGEPDEVVVEIADMTKGRNVVSITSVASLDERIEASLLSTNVKGGVTECRVRFVVKPGVTGVLYAAVEFRSPTGNKDVAFIGSILPEKGETP